MHTKKWVPTSEDVVPTLLIVCYEMAVIRLDGILIDGFTLIIPFGYEMFTLVEKNIINFIKSISVK